MFLLIIFSSMSSVSTETPHIFWPLTDLLYCFLTCSTLYVSQSLGLCCTAWFQILFVQIVDIIPLFRYCSDMVENYISLTWSLKFVLQPTVSSLFRYSCKFCFICFSGFLHESFMVLAIPVFFDFHCTFRFCFISVQLL